MGEGPLHNPCMRVVSFVPISSTVEVGVRVGRGLIQSAKHKGCADQSTAGFFFSPLVTEPRRSLRLKLSDTKVYEP